MWFEDIEIGARRDLGSYTFTEAEMIAFAKKYDPQPIHIDPDAAKKSIYGGLIASGWHTAAIWMKLAVGNRMMEPGDKKLNRAGVSPGFEDMRWLKPVRPGDTLYYSSEVAGKVDLKSRPTLGLVKSLNEARDAKGELYMSFIGKGFVIRRPTGE
ncbi:MAG TPA: MaoC family dehydratase [Rhizomicrobium sp.]|nr:MaoC family dehydratase [Rhizomicrobium sp.]